MHTEWVGQQFPCRNPPEMLQWVFWVSSNDKCALLSLQILVAAPIQKTTEFCADTIGDNVGICKLHPDHIVKGASDVGKSNMCCSFERQQFWCTYSFRWKTLENSPGSKGAVSNRSPPRCVEVPQPHSFQFGSSQALQGDGQAPWEPTLLYCYFYKFHTPECPEIPKNNNQSWFRIVHLKHKNTMFKYICSNYNILLVSTPSHCHRDRCDYPSNKATRHWSVSPKQTLGYWLETSAAEGTPSLSAPPFSQVATSYNLLTSLPPYCSPSTYANYTVKNPNM